MGFKNWLLEKALYEIRRVNNNNQTVNQNIEVDTGYGRKYKIPSLYRVLN